MNGLQNDLLVFFVEDAGEPLVVQVGERGIKQHLGFDDTIFLQEIDDVIDKSDLVGMQVFPDQKIGKGLFGSRNIKPDDGTDKISQWFFTAHFAVKIFLSPAFFAIKKKFFQLLQFR